jgi:hypothetical protein
MVVECLEVGVEVELNDREGEGQRKEHHWLTDSIADCGCILLESLERVLIASVSLSSPVSPVAVWC